MSGDIVDVYMAVAAPKWGQPGHVPRP